MKVWSNIIQQNINTETEDFNDLIQALRKHAFPQNLTFEDYVAIDKLKSEYFLFSIKGVRGGFLEDGLICIFLNTEEDIPNDYSEKEMDNVPETPASKEVKDAIKIPQNIF